ncbi:hypothetical protein J2TS6_46640 [Paenibacillus albilobatus]|uniref:Peptidase S8/S53 domain-containing protein n=1 Tax=Paenibacillus albilobatus TaxID=2716884 RepID=A0A920CD69_9BACL|nr:S8 family peptidase [Paenibacillus albilobatus]GIO33523.1 hypothetical protein J2TS6_46640 [Paenibacillus albilobatus]
MYNKDYPAKLIKLRSKDSQSGRIPAPIPGPAAWSYATKKEILKQFRELENQINTILESYVPLAKSKLLNADDVPLPIVFKMRKLAKSHRPDHILKELNSEIIAVHALGKLVVGLTEQSIEQLKEMISELKEIIPSSRQEWITKRMDSNGVYRDAVDPKWNREFELIHELTSIDLITSYTLGDALETMSVDDFESCKKDGELKVRFFKYESEIDDIIFSSFLTHFSNKGIRRNKIERLRHSHKIDTYVVPYVSDEIIKQMADFPGVETVSNFTRFQLSANGQILEKQKLQVLLPEKDRDYPRVAIVDSGISVNNKHLAAWIEAQETFVPPNRQNNYHGEFVGGILVYGHLANPNIQELIDSGVKILDVVVLPDPDLESIREDELLDALEEALDLYATEFKVWNLSLGSSRLCTGVISDFTAAIDELQDTYNVQFIIAAGNYQKMREIWPVEDVFVDDADRISLPADSMRAITVGSIACEDDHTTLVKKGEVTPYSRRGPGVGLSVKPDIVHFSGNPKNFPIYSINGTGELVADFGTSFSAPLVAGILAEYYQQFPTNLSKTTAKALLIHGSRHPITKKVVSVANDLYFYGFGQPKRIHDVLYGDEHEITLMFEGALNPKQNLNWIKISDFPFPQSLCTGNKIRGEILVTLVYEPHLNPRLGSEYSRSNVDIRLRSIVNGKPKTITKGIAAGEVPDAEKWEKTQMTNELKWSPIKQVQFLSPIGKEGSDEISLELFPTWRELTDKEVIPFSVVITIRDPKKVAPVYTEVSKLLLQSFQSDDINLRSEPARINYRG